MKRMIDVRVAGLCCGLVVTPVGADNSVVLDTLRVSEVADPESLLSLDIESALQDLQQTPGGVALITADDFLTGSVSGIQDVLAETPGVFIQSRFGNSETRMSIRGSGITQTFGVRGVRMLRDGLPITDTSGFTNPELIDPMTAKYVQVYKGANALEFGAATLGGAVNLVSLTGYDMPGWDFRQVIGSHNYSQSQLRGGQVFGNGLDGFMSLTRLQQSGFRDQSDEDVARGFLNMGYQNESGETRVILLHADNDLELPGSLTLAQLQDDPTQANAGFVKHAADRNLDNNRIDIHHTQLLSNGGQLRYGLFYEQRLLDHSLPFTIIDSISNDYGLSMQHHFTLKGGLTQDIQWGILAGQGSSEGDNFNVNFAQGGGASNKGALNFVNDDDARTIEWFIHDRLHLNPEWQALAGLQAVYADRHLRKDFVNPATTDIDLQESYRGLSPKLGLLWQPNEAVQGFTNISRSYEPPSLVELLNAGSGGALEAQTATTFELGSRGKAGIASWDVAVYRAWVRDEILFQEREPVPSGQFVTSNADETLHQGLEAGLVLAFPLNLLGKDHLDLTTSYTFNDFRFEDDVSFEDNRLPGIPEHFATIKLMYQHPSGYYAGPTVEAASDYFVDFANTFKAPSYTIFGFELGYQTKSGISWFVEAKNLEDEAYVSNTGIVANANGRDTGVFNPGLTKTVFAGITIPF